MKGAPSVGRPQNLAGFSLNLFTTLITCSHISCPVVVDERHAMSSNSSTASKTTVTALMGMTCRAVSLMSVLSYKASLKSTISLLKFP